MQGVFIANDRLKRTDLLVQDTHIHVYFSQFNTRYVISE